MHSWYVATLHGTPQLSRYNTSASAETIIVTSQAERMYDMQSSKDGQSRLLDKYQLDEKVASFELIATFTTFSGSF